jgi:hypothetical protein
MKNKPTLAQHLAGPYEEEMARYSAIVGEIEAYLDTFAPPLQAVSRPVFERLRQGEMSQVVALLPYWLSALLPLPDEIIHQLGVAHLYGFWYYEIQDKLLDNESDFTALLGSHLALLKMVEIYTSLGVTTAPCWQRWQQMALTSANCFAIERQTRFSELQELTPEQLSPWTINFLMDRAAPFCFNTVAQLHLAGIPAHDPLQEALVTALRCFGCARQLADDATDWLEDLRAGQLNYFSARLIQRLFERGIISSSADLEIDHLTGYQLSDETLWREIEETNQRLSQQALQTLDLFQNCRLALLIHKEMVKQAKGWAALRNHRTNFTKLFGI